MLPYQSQVGFPTVSPSSLRKVPDNVQSTKIPLLKFTELSGDTESFSSNKRNIDMLLRGAQKTEIVLLQRSPKIQKGGSWGPQGAMYPSESRTITQASHDRKKWLDVCFIQLFLQLDFAMDLVAAQLLYLTLDSISNCRHILNSQRT